jgi:hypothetical protein
MSDGFFKEASASALGFFLTYQGFPVIREYLMAINNLYINRLG